MSGQGQSHNLFGLDLQTRTKMMCASPVDPGGGLGNQGDVKPDERGGLSSGGGERHITSVT